MTQNNNFSRITAQILLETGSISFCPENPFTLISGRKSPVYVDCRRIISFPQKRYELMNLACKKIDNEIGSENIDVIAGGETAGIPFSAWISDRMDLPMVYVRKKLKGFGKNALIEGFMTDNSQTLLVEDLTTDGSSKLNFVNGLRDSGAIVNHIFTLFHYNIFSLQNLSERNIQLHALADWWDVLCEIDSSNYYSKKDIDTLKHFLNENS